MENKKKYEIFLKSGKGQISINPLKLEFLFNNKSYSVAELFDKIFLLEQELEEYKNQQKVKEDKRTQIESLLLESIQTLSIKVARIENKIDVKEDE